MVKRRKSIRIKRKSNSKRSNSKRSNSKRSNSKRSNKRSNSKRSNSTNKKRRGGASTPSFSINYANIGKIKDQDLTGQNKAYNAKPDVIISGTDNSKGKKYSVIMLDPDAPLGKGTRTWTHWFVTISSDGTIINELYPYQPPSPPPGSGKHRYIFNLYDEIQIQMDMKKNNLAGNDYYNKVIEPLLKQVKPIASKVQFTVTG